MQEKTLKTRKPKNEEQYVGPKESIVAILTDKQGKKTEIKLEGGKKWN
jgi:hypothetical protein